MGRLRLKGNKESVADLTVYRPPTLGVIPRSPLVGILIGTSGETPGTGQDLWSPCHPSVRPWGPWRLPLTDDVLVAPRGGTSARCAVRRTHLGLCTLRGWRTGTEPTTLSRY